MIHAYKLGGYNIVLDISSGSVHAVDELTYDILAQYESAEKADIKRQMIEKYGVGEGEVDECFEQIERLIDAGKLFSSDDYESAAGEFKQRSKGIIKALCLHVAHTCNLNCSYCFASQGNYHGDRALMSEQVGRRALDFLVENSGSRRNLEVDFFGGEPLMNFDVVKNLVKYARSIEKQRGKNFRFTLTTNGVLIDDEVIEFANREMNNVVLSLDGRKDVHDRFRVDYAGGGSFDKIVPRFQRLVKARGEKEYYIRGTFTHYNTDFLSDIQAMLDLGFRKLSLEPVVCEPTSPCALTQEDLPVVMSQYEHLAELMRKKRAEGDPFVFYHYMLDLKGGPCIYKRISGCGSGTEYMAVTPNGDLYPCHQFVGKDEFRLGNVFDGVKNHELVQRFSSCNVYSREKCKACWARLYCSGGCAANAYNATGSINGVYENGCTLFKKRMECAIMLEVDRLLGGEK